MSTNLHLDAASNLSDFFFRFHFHGLNNLPKADNLPLVLRSKGGMWVDWGLGVPDPRLLVLMAIPFCFLAEIKRVNYKN